MLLNVVAYRLLITKIQALLPFVFLCFLCSSQLDEACRDATTQCNTKQTKNLNPMLPSTSKPSSMIMSMTPGKTTLMFSSSTTSLIVNETWELSFKIKGTYKKEMDDPNSTEHSNLTEFLYDPIKNSCRQVLGDSFIRVKHPLRYGRGSILVTAVIELNENNPNINNTTLWENSLSSTLPGLFIENSTFIKEHTDFPTTTPFHKNIDFAPVIGAVCGVFLTILMLIILLSILIWRKRKVKDENRPSGHTQLSVSLPNTNRTLTWRESSGTTSISNSINSQKLFTEQEVDHISLHRPNIEKISFEGDFQSPVIHKDFKLFNSLNEFKQTEQRTSVRLPRILISQDEFGTMTTSSTSQSVQVVMSNNSAKASSVLPQRSALDVKPADFGGLFIPESTSIIGRASSFGLKLNRLNASMHKNEEVQDIDLSSLSNAGDLYSLKPSNSDNNINFTKASLPSTFKNYVSKDHDAKLHRDSYATKGKNTADPGGHFITKIHS